MEVEVNIDNIDDFMRMKPIKPSMSNIDKRRDVLSKIIKIQSKKNMLAKDITRLEKLQLELNEIEKQILSKKDK